MKLHKENCRSISQRFFFEFKERGQVIACINLLGLNNELYSSHLTLRLKILEMGIQASLIDLSESGTQNIHHQQV